MVETSKYPFDIFYINNMFLLSHTLGGLLFAIKNKGFLRNQDKLLFGKINKIKTLVSLKEVELYKITLFLGITLLLMHYYLIGGIPILRADREDFRVTSKEGLGQLVGIGLNLISVGVIIFSLRILNKEKKIGVKNVLLYIFFFLVAISQGYRGPAVQLIIIVFAIYQLAKERYFKYWTLITIIIVGLTFIGITAVLRWGNQGFDYLKSGTSYEYMLWMLSRSGSTNLGLDYILKEFYRSDQFLWGYSYYIDFITILPGYQPNFGLWLKDYLGQNWSGGSLMIGDSGIYYINFGFPGVIILGFLNAYFLNYVYKKFVLNLKNLKSLVQLIVIGITLNGFGDISSFIYSTILMFVLIELIWLTIPSHLRYTELISQNIK